MIVDLLSFKQSVWAPTEFWACVDNESFDYGPYSSVEEAVCCIIYECDLQIDDQVKVGRRSEIDISGTFIGADKILDDISEQMYEDIGDVSAGWLDAEPEIIDDLDKALRTVYTCWAKKMN